MPGTRWGDFEALLKHQIVTLKLPVDEVKIPGKSRNAIRAKVNRLSLIPSQPARAKWTRKQIASLRKLKRLGYSALDVFRSGLLGEPYRSLNAIRKEWGRKNLSDKKRRRAGKKKKVWQPSELSLFKEFLYKNSETQTPEQIAKQWGLARSTVSRWQSLLGLKLSRSSVLKLPHSVAKQKRGKKRGIKKYLAKRIVHREEERIRLRNEASRIIKEHPTWKTRECKACYHHFPLNPRFFQYSEKPANIGSNGTGKSRFYMRTCRMCTSDIRRQKSGST